MSKATDALVTGLKEIADAFAAQDSLDSVKSNIEEQKKILYDLQSQSTDARVHLAEVKDNIANATERVRGLTEAAVNIVSKAKADAEALAKETVAKSKQTADELIDTANKSLQDIAVKYDQYERKLQEKYDQVDAQNAILSDIDAQIKNIKAKF